MNTDELVAEEDITAALAAPPPKPRRGSSGRVRAATPEAKQAAASLLRTDSLSARERNKLKRKAKALNRQDSVKAGQDPKGRVSND